MKRFLFTILLMGLLVVFIGPAGNLFSTLLRLDEPTTYQIQEGDWLSKIAQKYYGDISYWRELELINRAPDGDLIYPGEKIIVPSFEAIQRVRKARALSDVNQVVDMQQDILAGRVEHATEPLSEPESEIAAPTEPTEMDEEPQLAQEPTTEVQEEKQQMPPEDEAFATNGEETSTFLSTPVITGLVVLVLILGIGIFMYVRKKKAEDVSFYGDASENEDEAEEDEKGRSPFYFGEPEDEERDKGSSKRNKEHQSALVK